MTVLKSLPSLRRLPSLLRIGETPVHQRFDRKLLEQWTPLIRSLARNFAIRRRLDPEDIEQELSLVLWRLTRRVDPNTRPEDFRRLIKTEMRNRCIDLLRHHHAQKRMARIGKALHCLCCDTLTRWVPGSEPVCPVCGARGRLGRDTKKVRWQDLRGVDISIVRASNPDDGGGSEDEGGAQGTGAIVLETMVDTAQHDPSLTAIQAEIRAHVRESLGLLEQQLFDLYLDPPPAFIQQLVTTRNCANPLRAPYWMVADYLGTSEKVLRRAHARICVSLARISDRQDILKRVSQHNLRQIGYVPAG